MKLRIFSRVCGVLFLCYLGFGIEGAAGQDEPPAERPAQPRVDACFGTTTPSFVEYIRPGWADVQNSGRFIVAVDPQYPRVLNDDGTESDDKAKSEKILRTVFEKIGNERSASAYTPVVINGDLTEFGHGWQREKMFELYRLMGKGKPGPLFFPGLGNHDYANNVHDCANNGCAADSVCDIYSWVNAIRNTAASPSHFDAKSSEDRMRGSMSYSVTVGKLHFIQLHDSPVYTTSFRTFVQLGYATFQIDPSLRWLEGNLREARAKGLIIFINLHKRTNWQNEASNEKFKSLMEGYGVTAAFAGHIHTQMGRHDTPDKFGKVPVFQAGALLKGEYLRVNYDVAGGRLEVIKLTPTVTELVGVYPLKGGTSLPPPPTDFNDSEITFYEGNSAGQKVVCNVMIAGKRYFNMNGTYGCSNDEARSLVIHKAKEGTLIYLYGNYNQHGNEGFARIRVNEDILLPVMIGSFDHDYTGQKWAIDHFGDEELDGKVSSVSLAEIHDYSRAFVALYETWGQGQSVVCTESVASNRRYNMGGQCANDEAKSADFHWVKAGTEVCYYGNWDQKTDQGYSCIYFRTNLAWAGVSTFDTNYDGTGMRISHYGQSIGGKISSTRVRVDVRESSLPAFEGPVEKGDGRFQFKEVREDESPVDQQAKEVQ